MTATKTKLWRVTDGLATVTEVAPTPVRAPQRTRIYDDLPAATRALNITRIAPLETLLQPAVAADGTPGEPARPTRRVRARWSLYALAAIALLSAIFANASLQAGTWSVRMRASPSHPISATPLTLPHTRDVVADNSTAAPGIPLQSSKTELEGTHVTARAAADALASGDDRLALRRYRALSHEYPQNAAYREAVRVLTARIASAERGL